MIIGVTGWAQHGKDTTGKNLVDNYGFVRHGFADALKKLALEIDPLIPTSEHLALRWRLSELVKREGWEGAKKYPETRRFLQELGNGARKVLGEDVWVEALDYTLNAARLTRHDNIVITDVRYPNEVAYIRRNGGLLWRVVRPGHDNGLGTNHPSEKFVEGFKVDAEFRAPTLDALRTQINDEMRRA